MCLFGGELYWGSNICKRWKWRKQSWAEIAFRPLRRPDTCERKKWKKAFFTKQIWQSLPTQQGAPEKRMTIRGDPCWAEVAWLCYFHQTRLLAGKSMATVLELSSKVLMARGCQLTLFLAAALRIMLDGKSKWLMSIAAHQLFFF